MARKGLLQRIQVADRDTTRGFGLVRDALEKLTNDDDLVQAPTAALIATGTIQPGATVVTYSGPTGQTLTLPPANARGQNVGIVLFILNTSPNTVTISATNGNTLNGATTRNIATGVMSMHVSDGLTKWQAI